MERSIRDKVFKILDSQETQDRLFKSILFNPIAKQFIRKYPAEYDIINTYDYGLEHINDIVKTQKVIDEPLHTGINGVVVNFKLYIDNIRIYGPGTSEHQKYSHPGYNAQSPNDALKNRLTYCALLIGDVHYSYQVIDTKNPFDSKEAKAILENAYIVNVPIPVGSKYCVLTKYDPLTLIRTGEDMEGAYGFFIIRGFVRYLIPYFTKPYNSPITLRNDYDDPTDNQLARMECLYSAGLDYENSYYVLAAIIRPKSHIGRGSTQIPILDYVFSLQMDDRCMNKNKIISRRKSLINVVPIKYLFYAFGCKSDAELIQYICPDMNDPALIHSIRQACLHGKYHISVANTVLGASSGLGYLKLDEGNKQFDTFTAKYVVGDIILSDEYKDKIKALSKNDSSKYRREIVNEVNRILRTEFMPGVGKNEEIDALYEIPENSRTEEQNKRIAKQEMIRNKAICYEMGQIVKDLYKIGNGISPSMDKISLTNRIIRHGQQIENEYKSFHSARLREIKVRASQFFEKIKSLTALNSKPTATEIENFLKDQMRSVGVKQSQSVDNAFKQTSKDKSKIRTDILQPKNQSFLYAKLREIVISSDSKQRGTGEQWSHRVVHPSHLYFIDPVYCPESGVQVGRYQQPTLYTYLTTGSLGHDIKNYIINHKNVEFNVDSISNRYIIKLNGSIIGYIKEYEFVEELYADLMKARRNGTIVRDCSVILKHQEGILDIWTGEGRMMTIFIEVKNCFETSNGQIGVRPNFLKWLNDCKENKVWELTKSDLEPRNNTIRNDKSIYKYGIKDCIDVGIEEGFITLYDPSMAIYNCCVAQGLEDYFEKPWLYNTIALPLHILSYPTSIAMCVNMNAGVRGSYASNHMKQAIGPTFRYPQIKYLNEMNVLLAPQIPLCRTCAYDLIGYNERPMGNNVIVAFMVYCDNQEDSFIVNRSSVESGLLIIDSLTVKSSECTKLNEKFEIPNDATTKKIGNIGSYMKLDPKTCLPQNVGDRFYRNDVLIAKVGQYNPDSAIKTDHSVLNEMPDACHPREANTRELRCVNKDIEIDMNTKEKMVVMGQRRCGIPGDKFNSCNAQKGTIGKVYDSTKMPYTKSGIRPDIIFNPPSIASRGTCGQIYEPVIAKLAALTGCPLDITPYQSQRSIEEIIEMYKKLGMDEHGYEDLYDPETGRCLGKVFIGIMQYQRQQHLVENKLNVRAIDGDVDKITGLAVKGRRRNGGQSLDRMTVDAINASGAVLFNRDTHLNQGAKMTIAICGICHKQYTFYSNDYKCWFCTCCGRHNNFIIKEVVPAQNLINHVFTGLHLTFEYKKVKDNNNAELLDTE